MVAHGRNRQPPHLGHVKDGFVLPHGRLIGRSAHQIAGGDGNHIVGVVTVRQGEGGCDIGPMFDMTMEIGDVGDGHRACAGGRILAGKRNGSCGTRDIGCHKSRHHDERDDDAHRSAMSARREPAAVRVPVHAFTVNAQVEPHGLRIWPADEFPVISAHSVWPNRAVFVGSAVPFAKLGGADGGHSGVFRLAGAEARRLV